MSEPEGPCTAPAGDVGIGEAARLAGTTVEALRYYEAEHLVRPRRDAAGRRRYDQRCLDALEVVTSLRRVGFPVQAVRRLIEQKSDAPPQVLVPRARAVIDEFSADLDTQQAAIERARALLQRWQAELDGTGW